MGIYFEIAGNQSDGAREYQEDAFLTTYIDDADGEPKATALVILADGMGGHAAGNIASNLAVSTLNKGFTGEFGKDSNPVVLRASLMQANDALKSAISETPALDGMGCTMVAALFAGGKVWWVSVGDSHLYVIRNKNIDKKNEDHSYGGYLDRMKAAGMDVEAEAGLSRNMLMSAMTGDEIVEIDCPREPFELKSGDRVLIASDGLDTLSKGMLLQLAEWSEAPKEYVDTLLKAIVEAGKPRQDNTTVVVVDVLGEAESDSDFNSADIWPDDLEQTQERSLSDMQDEDPTLAEEEREDITEPGAEREYLDYDEDEESGPGRLIAIIIIAVVLLAGIAGAAWYFLRGDGGGNAPAPAAQGTVPAPAPAPVPKLAKPAPVAPATVAQPPAPIPAPAPAAQPAPVVQPVIPAPVAAPVSQEFRDALKSGGEGPTMVVIPGGTFRMGSPGFSVNRDERPRHEVTVPSVAFSKYEVTYAEYGKFAKATNRTMPEAKDYDLETFPVAYVSWDDAYAYTRWLSQQTGKKYRLPSEAEWEYAAAGNSDESYWWGFEFKKNMAHCFRCGSGLRERAPARVGHFKANAFGLYDTAGNVAEWVKDCYHKTYQDAPNDGSVWEGGDCRYRVVRGGSFDSPAPSVRRTKRAKAGSTRGYDTIGIRLARDL